MQRVKELMDILRQIDPEATCCLNGEKLLLFCRCDASGYILLSTVPHLEEIQHHIDEVAVKPEDITWEPIRRGRIEAAFIEPPKTEAQLDSVAHLMGRLIVRNSFLEERHHNLLQSNSDLTERMRKAEKESVEHYARATAAEAVVRLAEDKMKEAHAQLMHVATIDDPKERDRVAAEYLRGKFSM